MKILIIQLARYADILQSYPAVRSLRNQYPKSEIHVLVRERFRHAACRLTEADCIFTFPTDEILENLFGDGLLEADQTLGSWLDDVRDHDYDLVINLSFNTISSYVTHAIARPQCKVAGFSRHADGQFALTDQMSRYFYSHVGLDRPNQKSLAELFCHTALVPPEYFLDEVIVAAKGHADFDVSKRKKAVVVIHADIPKSNLNVQFNELVTFVTNFAGAFRGNLILVGTQNSDSWTDAIEKMPGEYQTRVINKIGCTKFEDLFQLCENASYVIGFDSLLLQIAFLTATPSVMLAANGMNHFETVPHVDGTVVYEWPDANNRAGQVHLIKDLVDHLNEVKTQLPIASWTSNGWVYQEPETAEKIWTRELLEILYFDGDGQVLGSTPHVRRGIAQMQELGALAIFQLNNLKANQNASLQGQILERINETIDSVGRVVPQLQPMTAWFHALRGNVLPGTAGEVIAAFKKNYFHLIEICEDLSDKNYLIPSTNQEKQNGTFRVG